MKEILKLGLRLMIISVIATLLLAGTNMLTQEPIARQKAAKAQAAMEAVMPGQTEFELVYAAADDGDDMRSVYSCDGGAVLTVVGHGYSSGGVTVTVGVLSDGSVSQIRVDASGETPGLGAKAGEESYYGRYVGLTSDSLGQADAITGATRTSDAVKGAVKAALDYFNDNMKGGR